MFLLEVRDASVKRISSEENCLPHQQVEKPGRVSISSPTSQLLKMKYYRTTPHAVFPSQSKVNHFFKTGHT